MSYRSSPAFSAGGVSWLDHEDNPSDSAVVPPCGGWTCFHCGEVMKDYNSAARHFGKPGSKAIPECLPLKAERRSTGDHFPLVEILRVTASGGIWV